MSLRSVTVSIRSTLDRVFSQIENHEAVAESALGELHAAVARVSSQVGRLTRSGERLRGELSRERHQLEQWRQRAKECSDDARAIECLKRSRHHAQSASELEQRLNTQQQLEERLKRDLDDLRRRHGEMLERHRALRARESRALAYQLVNDQALVPNLEDVFERWESQVTEQEYFHTPMSDGWDQLEEEFVAEEERAELRAELAALRGEK